jgi:hypothetical protein
MTNIEKYEKILTELALGRTQSDITISCKCSFGTITRAKAWALKEHGYPVVDPPKNSSSRNSSSISSSEFTKKGSVPVKVDYNSRFLSWMGSVLTIEKYWDLSKEVLKSKIIEKVNLI